MTPRLNPNRSRFHRDGLSVSLHRFDDLAQLRSDFDSRAVGVGHPAGTIRELGQNW